MNSLSRRDLIGLGITLLAGETILNFTGLSGKARAAATLEHSFLDRVTGTLAQGHSNFRWTYTDDKRAADFFPFLENVFHLFPPAAFQKMLHESSIRFSSDPEIYREVLRRVPEIKPFLSEFNYALPALKVQKKELASQSFQLLGKNRSIRGYLEMGAPGRYLGSLKEGLDISGPAYIFHDVKPGYSPIDIIERGGLAKNGTYVPMGNYNLLSPEAVPDESLDLITNFIGFHHCPAARRPAFIVSLKHALRKGGTLLLRDHDVGDRNRDVLVALAHDVFNAGLSIPWDETAQQIRNFRSAAAIEKELTELGFKREGEILYQKGDPTLNGMMKFIRVS